MPPLYMHAIEAFSFNQLMYLFYISDIQWRQKYAKYRLCVIIMLFDRAGTIICSPMPAFISLA